MKTQDRRALLARVHIGKKEMGLDQGAYSALVSRVTGKQSAGDCSVAELRAVLEDMRAHGWKPRTGQRASQHPHVRKVWAIWASMEPLLDAPDRAALRGFVQRQTRSPTNPLGVSDPNFLSVADAKKVIHGLEGWRGRLLLDRAQAEAANAKIANAETGEVAHA